MVATETDRWQSVCKRYEVELDMAARIRIRTTGERIFTAVLDPSDKMLCIDTRSKMDAKLRKSQRGARLADHINACTIVPDGLVLAALVHVVVIGIDDSPVVGEWPVWNQATGGAS